MRKFETLPIARLVNDVAVDPVHVRELADSIKVSGPIAPVMVRQDTYALIDGFHRVAAMQELGFTDVECILTDCDDETFWDLRIMSASLHKSVAFARAADWVEECFRVSPWTSRYKSAYNLFAASRQRSLEPEIDTWAKEKAQKWGLSPSTIENWLYTKQSLAPDLLEEARESASSSRETRDISFGHFYEVAQRLPNEPDLQRKVVEKARSEGLSKAETGQVARAVRQAPNPDLVSGILEQPVSRTADDLTRSAIVERLPEVPRREPSDRERERVFRGRAFDVAVGIEQLCHEIDALGDDAVAAMLPHARQQLDDLAKKLSARINALRAKLQGPGVGTVVEGRLVSGR